MHKVITACMMGAMTIRQAALNLGVPKPTLGDRLSGRILPGATSGPRAYLTTEKEEKYILHCAAIGYSKVPS